MLGTEGVLDAYRTGRGRCIVRAKSHVETVRIKNKGELEQLVFTELPYQVNKATLTEKIAELVHDKKIDGIGDLRDESDREGIRLVVELKKNEPSDIVLNQLYQQTQLQSSFPITMLCIVNGQPRVCTLREILKEFLGFRREVVTRRTLFQLRKAEERHHILLGLKIALDHLDAVIKLIRAAKSPRGGQGGPHGRRLRHRRRPQEGPDPRPCPTGRPRPSWTCASSASPAWSGRRSSRSWPRWRRPSPISSPSWPTTPCS